MNKFLLGALTFASLTAWAQPFYFPTANHALYEKGGEERFFVPTPGHDWTSGCFGCVRSGGHQMHEGLDIKCLQRDRRGEPTDPVLATADGVVVYMSDKPGLSNYGRYIVVRHLVDGLEIYSLYAHLSAFAPGIKVGKSVRAGEQLAVMGHTGAGISRDRSHVHFELNLYYNDHFSSWFRRHYPNEHDDHGVWNGQNLVGMDPRLVLLEERAEGSHFSLLQWVQRRPVLCRVLVHKADFSFVRRYPLLVRNPGIPPERIAGYDVALDFNGLPFEMVPRTASQMPGSTKYTLLSVNAAEFAKNPCRKLVARSGKYWQLTSHGLELLDLLTN